MNPAIRFSVTTRRQSPNLARRLARDQFEMRRFAGSAWDRFVESTTGRDHDAILPPHDLRPTDRQTDALAEYRQRAIVEYLLHAVLGGLFRSMWGLSKNQTERVFPQARPLDLGLV